MGGLLARGVFGDSVCLPEKADLKVDLYVEADLQVRLPQ
jgi:hypothetical protein